MYYLDNRGHSVSKPKNDNYKSFYDEYINDGLQGKKKEDPIYKEKFFEYIKSLVNNFIGGVKDNIILFLGAGASVLGKNWEYGKTMSYMACKIIEDLYFKEHHKNGEPYSLNEITRNDEILSFEEFASLSNLNKTQILNNLNQVLFNMYQKNINEDSFELENFISTLNAISLLGDEKNNNGIKISSTIENSDPNFINKVQKTEKKIKEEISLLVNYNNYPFGDKEESFKHLSIIKALMSKLDEDDRKLEVITTNYDKVIEEAANEGRITVFDGFGFGRGSSFDDSWFDWNLSRKVKGIDTNEVEYNKNVIDLLKLHGSIDWSFQDGKVIKESTKNNKPVMIFPSSDKYRQSYDKPYFELLSRFEQMLQRPNSLLVTSGFSFSDKHISRMVIDAIKTNNSLRILVTDYNINKSSFGIIKDLIDDGYDVALLQAAMNDPYSDHGLSFYLR